MIVLVCGDRDWTDRDKILARLSQLPPDTIIVEGEARGADRMGREVAQELGLDWWPFPANWDEHHRAAGPIRNRKMLKEGRPDLVIAFHSNLDESKGTKDMVEISRKAGVPIEIIQ